MKRLLLPGEKGLPARLALPSRPFLQKTLWLLAALLQLSVSANAQHTVTRYSNESDYTIRYVFSGFYNNGCQRWFELRTGPNGSGDQILLADLGTSTTSGTVYHAIGPNQLVSNYITANYKFDCENDDVYIGRDSDGNHVPRTTTTLPLRAPNNLTATTGTSLYYIDLKWEKATDVPDGEHVYRIRRNGVQIAEVAGSVRTYRDNSTTLLPGVSYTYTVVTYAGNWNQTSVASNLATGSLFSVGTAATDGEFYNRVKVSWNNLGDKGAEEIKVERSLPGSTSQFEELAIVSKNATSYNDYDGIPGYTYTYRVSPVTTGASIVPATETGYRKPNGIVKGEVKSPFGAGISGVVVTLNGTFSVEGVATTKTYRDTTDASGFYEIKDIYYHREAEYTLTPAKTNHGFKPATLKRNFDLNAPTVTGANFTDTTVYTIAGRVYLPGNPASQTCPARDVEIYLNGRFTGVKTAADGTYFIPVEEEGSYTITPRFRHHTFSAVINNARTNNGSRTLAVTRNVSGVDFVDTQTDQLILKLAGACNNTIANSAQFLISSVNATGCFKDTVTVTGSNDTPVTLPAQAYRVQLMSVSPANTNIVSYFQPIEIDLTSRDTLTRVSTDSTMRITPADTVTLGNGKKVITPADTTYEVTTDTLKTVKTPRTDFIYRSAIAVNITGWPGPVCVNNGTGPKQVIRMDQGEEYRLQIEVNNVFTFNGQTTVCRVDTGTVTIFDEISDRNDPITLPIEKGYAYYTVKAGNPNIAGGGTNPYQKLFQVKAKVGFLDPYVSTPTYVLVTGDKPRQATFFTKTPELPFHIIHDPVGDASYSYLEKGTTISHTYATDVLLGGGAGVFARAKVGSAIKVFGVKIGGFFVNAQLNTEFGRDNVDNNSVTTSLTTTERFSTSGDDAFTGAGGDVFIGGSLNMIYSLTDVVNYDPQKCKVVRDTTLAWLADGLATTYIYTDKHIRGTLIPQLESLKKLADPFRKDSLQNSIDLWKQVLTKNDEQKAKARFKENISFSAGAPVEKSITTSKDTSVAYEYKVYIDLDAALSAQLDVVDNEFELGAKATFRWSKTTTESDDTTRSTTVGYHLEDDDIGDYYSVDVLEDRVYGTPVFRLAAGTSSCPYEPGTLPRDAVQFTLDTYSVSGVPADKPATFIANLTNLSQSEETREYQVRMVTTSNLDGAVVRLGGQVINSNPTAFFIPPGETMKTLLTVERGPTSSVYEKLKLIMYSECDYALWSKGGDLAVVDTVTFDVYFRSECSNVALYAPGNNWLVNKKSNNVLNTALTGFDITNPGLQRINVQYRQVGESWQVAATIEKSQLVQRFYDYAFDVSALPDGNYELRAEAVCVVNQVTSTTYSSVQQGVIDRNSLAPFGRPTPSDGFLRAGQEISMIFDKPINCNVQSYAPVISLVRADNGAAIAFTVQCAANLNKIILAPVVPLSTRRELDGVELVASVNGIRDQSGNVQQYPVAWSFKVNAKPVFWDPATLKATAVFGTPATVVPSLKSAAEINKAFTITAHPEWLIPAVTEGAILSNNAFPVTFSVKSDLKPGIYSGTIKAVVDGFEEVLPVTLEMLAVPVGWKVNPADYNFSMNVVAQFSLDNSNTNLSTDTRDIIGVFVNGVARGVARIQKDQTLNKYFAFMTVYSNEPQAGREILTFRMWRALTGVEYGAVERPAFAAETTLGSGQAPYILHPEGVFQVIPLAKGWNWVSLNVTTADMSREKIFTSILSSGNRITVKSQSDFTEFSPSSGWSGTLKTLNTASGYMVFLSDKPDTLRVVGNAAAITPVALAGNWNWIGYPRQTPASLNAALGSYGPKAGDHVKSSGAFAIYTVSGQTGFWLGDLKEMEPGKGYKLRLSTPASLSYPAGRKAQDESGFEVNEHGYEFNMTLTAALLVNNAPVAADQYTIGAYIDGVCRGFARLVEEPGLTAHRGYLTIHGDAADAGKEVEFRVFGVKAEGTQVASGQSVTFRADQITGSALSPHLLSLEADVPQVGNYLAQNRPNPFSRESVIAFTLAKDESVRLTLYNQYGVPVKVLLDEDKPAGAHQVVLKRNDLPSGVYMYTLKAGRYVQTLKLVVVR